MGKIPMQSAILDYKIFLTCLPIIRDKIRLCKQVTQNGSMSMLGFGRHLNDIVKYVNHEMSAEEATFAIAFIM
jgi:hypothetical protein